MLRLAGVIDGTNIWVANYGSNNVTRLFPGVSVEGCGVCEADGNIDSYRWSRVEHFELMVEACVTGDTAEATSAACFTRS